MAHRNVIAANGNSAIADDAATLTVDRAGDETVLRAAGDWDIAAAARLETELDSVPATGGQHVTLDLSGLTAIDTAGAWLLHRTRERLAAAGAAVRVVDAPPDLAGLMEAVDEAAPQPPPALSGPGEGPLVRFVGGIGRATVDFGRESLALLNFLGMLVVRLGGAVVHPRRLRAVSIVHHMEATGLAAMPIVGLLSFLIGVVLAYQGADQLRQFGAEIFVVNLLGISVLRELGALITAIIVAGRSGSAFTAQIGTMKVNQEVDAMRTLGLDPVDILTLPRVIALMVTLPLLVFYADIVALFGGAVMSWAALGITFPQFMGQLQSAVDLSQFWVGMVKAPVFAFTIAMVGCYQGLKVGGSAESVGRLTTTAVVQSIFLVIVLDAIFSIIFATMGV